MHSELPWIEGPRTPRPVLPRLWAPRRGEPIEAVILAPFRRLAVHWSGQRHWLHFPGECHGCPQFGPWTEHGYAAALCRLASSRCSQVEGWEPGVVQLTEGPLSKVVFRSTEPWIYTLSRNGGTTSMVSTERRECPRQLWLLGRPFDPSPTLERVYGLRWKDAAGKLVGAAIDPRGKAGDA